MLKPKLPLVLLRSCLAIEMYALSQLKLGESGPRHSCVSRFRDQDYARCYQIASELFLMSVTSIQPGECVIANDGRAAETTD
jgi:hypothetical protein